MRIYLLYCLLITTKQLTNLSSFLRARIPLSIFFLFFFIIFFSSGFTSGSLSFFPTFLKSFPDLLESCTPLQLEIARVTILGPKILFLISIWMNFRLGYIIQYFSEVRLETDNWEYVLCVERQKKWICRKDRF